MKKSLIISTSIIFLFFTSLGNVTDDFFDFLQPLTSIIFNIPLGMSNFMLMCSGSRFGFPIVFYRGERICFMEPYLNQTLGKEYSFVVKDSWNISGLIIDIIFAFIFTLILFYFIKFIKRVFKKIIYSR